MKPLVYVAGPYSGNVTYNVMEAIKTANYIADLGFAVIVPHQDMLWDMLHPGKGYEFFMDQDIERLDRCDALFRMPGVSPGADREVARANERGIPVFTSMRALCDWRDKGWKPLVVGSV